jgi:hypothetical protein
VFPRPRRREVTLILIGFCGSRRLARSWASLISRVVAGVRSSGFGVATGCAPGADQLVRRFAGPGRRVFRAASRRPAALAARSAACVRAVARAGPGSAFAGFVSSPCPPGLVPSPSSRACFCGLGSGSWASLALAAGLGLPVFVFWCGPGPPALPAAWGLWSPVASGPFAGGWRLARPRQLSLF